MVPVPQWEKGNLFSSIIYALVVVGVITSGGSVPYLPGFLIWGGFLNGAIALEPAAGMFFILGVLHVSISLFACLLIAKYIFKNVFNSPAGIKDGTSTTMKNANNNTKPIFCILLAFIDSNLFRISSVIINFEPSTRKIYFAIKRQANKEIETWRTPKIKGAYCIHLFEDFNVYAMVVLTVLVLGLVTQVMHNLVLGAIFLPILIPMGMAMGLCIISGAPQYLHTQRDARSLIFLFSIKITYLVIPPQQT
mgnify:CR=1 FL=1